MHQMRLVAGLRPDPLVELTALPISPSWIIGEVRARGGEWERGGGRGGTGEGEGRRRGKTERGGPPMSEVC